MSSSQSGSEKINYADVVKAGLPQVSYASLPTTSPPSSLVTNMFATTINNVPVTTVPLSALTAESVPSTAMIMSSAPNKFFSNDSTYFNVNVNNILNSNSIRNSSNCEQKGSAKNSNDKDKTSNAEDNIKGNNIKNALNVNVKKEQHEEEQQTQQKQQKQIEQNQQKQIEETQERENSHKHSTATLPAMAANAKPYIPSYLAAAKRSVGVVKLDGVPVNVNEHSKTTDAWCSSTVSTSLMDPESNSSWADDDESFLQTVARQQDAMRVKMVHNNSSNNSNNAKNNCNTNDNDRQIVRRENANNNNSNSNNISNRFSFEFINDDEEEFNCSTGSRRNRERFAQVHNRVGRRGNWKNRNYNNQTQQQTQCRIKSNNNNGNNKQQDSNNIISGGRFDVLANPRVMRHL